MATTQQQSQVNGQIVIEDEEPVIEYNGTEESWVGL